MGSDLSNFWDFGNSIFGGWPAVTSVNYEFSLYTRRLTLEKNGENWLKTRSSFRREGEL
jgi:hypothetical protein